jgi:hypothetical protein
MVAALHCLQVARQQGEYLATLFSNHLVWRERHGQLPQENDSSSPEAEKGAEGVELGDNAPPFM